MRRPVDFLIMQRGERQADEVATVRAYSPHGALAAFERENSTAKGAPHGLPVIEDWRRLYAIRKVKPSGEMLHVLQLASQQGTNIHYVPLVNGKGSQSRTVGRSATIEACQRRGWLDYQGDVTQAGREARAAEEAKQESR